MIADDHQGYYPHRFWYDWVTCAEYQDEKLTGTMKTAAGLTVSFDRIYCVGESKDGQYLPDEANTDN